VTNSADVIVLGLGVMGAASTCELARRGASVIALDAYAPPHDRGSSHGRTRIIREAYFEHPLYVPLVQRAWELWQELEELTGSSLYQRTGGVMIGPPDGVLVRGSLESARVHRLERELLSADAIMHRFPALLPEPDHVGVFEPRAGTLNAEGCVRTLVELARGYGATLRLSEAATAWRTQEGCDVVVETSRGQRLRAPLLVIAVGPWLNRVLAADASASPLRLPLTVERQVSHWFAAPPGASALRAPACPIAIWEYERGRFLYTFPDAGSGVKVGIHHEGELTDPEEVQRGVHADEDARARRLLSECIPSAASGDSRANVCLYTNAPDGHFLLDRHPGHEQVLLVSPCSGHGFKFATAIGEAVAEMLLEGGSRFDLSAFGAARLLAASTG
jgi:sarcosine oxidase